MKEPALVKAARAVVVAPIVLMLMAGCGVSAESSIKEQAEFRDECHDAGGEVWYDGFNRMRCDFTDDPAEPDDAGREETR